MTRGNVRSLAYVLSGGEGERLLPLTSDRTKPAVPFAGSYRVIDFVLSNLHHSGIREIYVLTQYEHHSLNDHIRRGWQPRFGLGGDGNLEVIAPTLKREGGRLVMGYKGTAGAVTSNISRVRKYHPQVVDVFSGDHVYLMDISEMNEFHLDNGADLTISAVPVRRERAARKFGVLVVDSKNQVIGFQEKPEDPSPIPGDEEFCFASMGNYVFKPGVLLEELEEDSQKLYVGPKKKHLGIEQPGKYSGHDFGMNVIPAMLRRGRRIYAYDFRSQLVPGAVENERSFWRDIGDLDQFYIANMEMRDVVPPLNIYNPDWPLLTHVESPQPAKTVGMSGIWGSLVSNGCIISGGNVSDSILGYNTRLEGASVIESVLLGYSCIKPGAEIRRTIVDRNVIVPAGVKIGFNQDEDRARGFTISSGGITVVPKGYRFQ
jgi:glucose-1-phosphate adenylyltransferase